MNISDRETMLLFIFLFKGRSVLLFIQNPVRFRSRFRSSLFLYISNGKKYSDYFPTCFWCLRFSRLDDAAATGFLDVSSAITNNKYELSKNIPSGKGFSQTTSQIFIYQNLSARCSSTTSFLMWFVFLTLFFDFYLSSEIWKKYSIHVAF